MTFLWPAALVLLLALPAFLAFYIVHEKRKRETMRYASIYAAVPGLARPRTFARHAPLALFLVSIAAVALAVARPQTLVTLLSVKGTIVLAASNCSRPSTNWPSSAERPSARASPRRST